MNIVLTVCNVLQMNISEAEYAAKYETYLQTVRENRKLRLQRDVPTTTQRFYTFPHLSNKVNTVSRLYCRIHTRFKTVIPLTVVQTDNRHVLIVLTSMATLV